MHGVPPARPSRLQVVLSADGRVSFNYAAVALRDGIVGLFPNHEVTKGRRIASIPNRRDPRVPAHVDLLDATIYESSTDGLIVEWTIRGRIGVPRRGTIYSYRLHLDVDEPYFDGRE